MTLDGSIGDMLSSKEILAQIDRALKSYTDRRDHSKYDDLSDLGGDVHAEVKAIVRATLDRLAPPGSTYRKQLGETLVRQVGVLRALRRDYNEGCINTVQGLIRADVFADFLEMADHLLAQGYKDPAAVLVGGVLEEHLRGLCTTRSIPTSASGRPKKADAMNNELAGANAYTRLDQKNVTAWLDLRNRAAHAKYTEYTNEQVHTMLAGVREFIARLTA